MRDIIVSHLITNFVIFREKAPPTHTVISSNDGWFNIIHDDTPVHIVNETLPGVDSLYNPASEHLVAMLKKQPFLVATVYPDLTDKILEIFFFNKPVNPDS